MRTPQPHPETAKNGQGVAGQAVDLTGAAQCAALNRTTGQRSIPHELLSRDEIAEDQLRQIRRPGQPPGEPLITMIGGFLSLFRQLDEPRNILRPANQAWAREASSPFVHRTEVFMS
jgi:hypothetical protein